MHVVEGRGNTLHNHQVVLGLLLLPVIGILLGEFKVFSWMPTNFGKFFTWQCWGTLVVAGTIPFIKNMIANRMIRRTGQAPWRLLEIISMVLVFSIGSGVWDTVTVGSVTAFILVLTGRIVGTLDVLSKDPNERRRAIRQEAQHGSAPPPSPNGRYDPTGVADSFDHADEMTIEDDGMGLTFEESGYNDVEMCKTYRATIRPKQQSLSQFCYTETKPLRLLMEAIPEEVVSYSLVSAIGVT